MDKQLVFWLFNDNTRKCLEILRANPHVKDAKPFEEGSKLYMGLPVLCVAALRQKTEVFRHLLNISADVNAIDSEGDTTLHVLMTVYYSSSNINGNAEEPLARKWKQIVEMLIQGGANIGLQNNAGRTILHIAAIKQDHYTFKDLIEKGCNMNIKDTGGNSPVHLVLKCRSWRWVSTMSWLMYHPSLDIMQRDNRGYMLIHTACSTTLNVGAVELLLKREPTLQNERLPTGFTPLMVAAVNDVQEAADSLLKQRKQNGPDVAEPAGEVAVHIAAASGSKKVLKVFVKYGADLRCVDEDGATPFHWLTDTLKMGLDLPQRQRNQYLDKKFKVAKFLIDHGANTEVRNASGETPLTVCPHQQFRNMVKDYAEKRTKCQQCYKRLANMRLQPCGHKQLCQICSISAETCPACENTVEDKVQEKVSSVCVII